MYHTSNGLRCRIVLIAFLTALAALPSFSFSQDRLRVIIETDAGGDPDDEQSLVRFLLYANEWDVEGIIANRPHARDKENLNPERTGFRIVKRLVKAYEEVYPHLKLHAENYPPPEQLLKRTVCGYADCDDAVNLIIEAVDRDDPRPIWFQNWGTDHGADPSNLKRALDKILAERGQAGYTKFKNKILLCSDDKFGDHTHHIKPLWRMWVNAKHPKFEGKAWYHRFGPLTQNAGGFDLERDVRTGHGPLGALYPTNTNIPQKEGDSLLFLYLMPTGMNDPMQPTWGSWAGRFVQSTDRPADLAPYYWASAEDTFDEITHRDQTLVRWAADLQNDFRARMDWCVEPFANANHAPIAILDEDRSRKIPLVKSHVGSVTQLDASNSIDPDKNSLTYHWQIYREPSSFEGDLVMQNEFTAKPTLELPRHAKGKRIHLLLTIRDDGSPPLTSYRRVILKVE